MQDAIDGYDVPTGTGSEFIATGHDDHNWTLDMNGTLRIMEDGAHHSNRTLERGAFEAFRNQVRRIEIHGFESIANDTFSYYPALEGVVIDGDELWTLGDRAFAHCHKLESIDAPENLALWPWVFEDTPFQAQRNGTPFQPQFSPVITRDAHGKELLAYLWREIDAMHEQPDGEPIMLEDHWPYDRNEWFDSLPEILIRGWANDEPALSYLMAEYLNNALDNRLYTQGLLAKAQVPPIDPEDERLEPPAMYLHAARCGSPHAQLWSAFCLDQGIDGWGRDAAQSQEMLSLYAQQPEPLTTLELPELDFLPEELHRLVQAAYDADLTEDLVGDRFNYSPDAPYPNPSWRALHLRVIDMANFLIDLGRTYVTECVGYDYRWDSYFEIRAEDLLERKEAWKAWCLERNLLA